MCPDGVILDTNVISLIARDSSPTLLNGIIDSGAKIFVPYFILQELLSGQPSGEIEFLMARGAELEDNLSEAQLDAISIVEKMQLWICQMLVFGKAEGLTYAENLWRNGFGPVHLNNLRPPHIVQKIVKRLAALPDGDAASHYFGESDSDLQISDKITLQALLLVLLGFWRDRQMLKARPDLSLKGLRKQYQDAKLIGVASQFSSLISADLRLCLIAYAVFEHNLVRTKVHFISRSGELNVISVSDETWSSLTTRSA